MLYTTYVIPYTIYCILYIVAAHRREVGDTGPEPNDGIRRVIHKIL